MFEPDPDPWLALTIAEDFRSGEIDMIESPGQIVDFRSFSATNSL